MTYSPSILEEITEHKLLEVLRKKRIRSESSILSSINSLPLPRDFAGALTVKIAAGHPAVIAEVKKASPISGTIRDHFNPVAIALEYEAAGDACLSVLTDERFFAGQDKYLFNVKHASAIPVLRKDFILDQYQILEARALQADCVLLIAAMLTDDQLRYLYSVARELGMDILLEVHNIIELERALELSPKLIGINNRNLHTFSVSLETTVDLMKYIPAETLIVSESGIRSKEDVKYLQDQGVRCFLVGEALMASNSVAVTYHQMFGV